jgi:hypothetical protein
MTDNLELLTKIQEQIIKCRRLAAEMPDSKLALLLCRLADEVEAEAREADLIQERGRLSWRPLSFLVFRAG